MVTIDGKDYYVITPTSLKDLPEGDRKELGWRTHPDDPDLVIIPVDRAKGFVALGRPNFALETPMYGPGGQWMNAPTKAAGADYMPMYGPNGQLVNPEGGSCGVIEPPPVPTPKGE